MFPSAIEDAVAAYVALLGSNAPKDLKYTATLESKLKSRAFLKEVFDVEDTNLDLKASQIVVMGDSSGGCLSVQFVSVLQSLGLPMPKGVVLISPFLDHGE
jgi:acetyl esterase/lipase